MLKKILIKWMGLLIIGVLIFGAGYFIGRELQYRQHHQIDSNPA